MAEALLKNKVKNNEALKGKVSVHSCGIDADEYGHALSPAVQIMDEYGIDMRGHRTTHIDNSGISGMDLVLCAETGHKRFVLRDFPALSGKVYTLKEYAGHESDDMNISDPFGWNLNTYRRCAAEIDACLDKVIELL
jgi:protein-tyrosine-phosphatase